MVPLLGENRVLVRFGLKVLAKTKRLGLQKLYTYAGINPDKITVETIGYQIAPRINAAGRMDHANTAYELLSAQDAATADEFAKLLDAQNKDRQKVSEGMYQEARKESVSATARSLVIYHRDWPSSLAGLVAGKLVQEFGKPTFLLSSDETKIMASGRGIPGIDIMQALHPIQSLLTSYGGHPQACGFRCNLEHRDAVMQHLTDYFEKIVSDEDLLKVTTVDEELSFGDITWALVDTLALFEPYGQGNRQPTFMTRNVKIVDQRSVGPKMNHAKYVLEHSGRSLPAIGFDMVRHNTKAGESYDILYCILINQWNGNREIQLRIQSITTDTADHES